MATAKILVFAGSIRAGSFNDRLAALATKELALADVEVTRISLVDYPLPIYDADLEAGSGVPDSAVKLKRQFMVHRGIFIASPEYNASVTPLLKNAIDWVSRVREGNEVPLAAFKRRIFAIGAASNGSLGGYRSLMALRQILELGCGATVLPEQIAVREAASAFDDDDRLRDERAARTLRTVLERLVETARQLANL
jgi:NAD(P)H-dependent FMN reductase